VEVAVEGRGRLAHRGVARLRPRRGGLFALAHRTEDEVQTFEARVGGLHAFIREVRGGAVMRSEQECANGRPGDFLQEIFDEDAVAERLRHLHPVPVDHVVVQPVAGEALAGRRPGLGDFAFVVGELILQAAAVDVEFLAEVLHRHRRAFDVPSGVALAPRAAPPLDVGRVGVLPQREVARVALVAAHRDPRAFDRVVRVAARQAAVVFPRADAEVDVAARFVGVPLREELFDDLDLLGDVLRRAPDGGRRRRHRALPCP
jgi:hypothetical protein